MIVEVAVATSVVVIVFWAYTVGTVYPLVSELGMQIKCQLTVVVTVEVATPTLIVVVPATCDVTVLETVSVYVLT